MEHPTNIELFCNFLTNPEYRKTNVHFKNCSICKKTIKKLLLSIKLDPLDFDL